MDVGGPGGREGVEGEVYGGMWLSFVGIEGRVLGVDEGRVDPFAVLFGKFFHGDYRIAEVVGAAGCFHEGLVMRRDCVEVDVEVGGFSYVEELAEGYGVGEGVVVAFVGYIDAGEVGGGGLVAVEIEAGLLSD